MESAAHYHKRVSNCCSSNQRLLARSRVFGTRPVGVIRLFWKASGALVRKTEEDGGHVVGSTIEEGFFGVNLKRRDLGLESWCIFFSYGLVN